MIHQNPILKPPAPTTGLTMVNVTIAKGSTVEVSSEEPGFNGAWYVATLVDEAPYSPTKRKGSNKKNRIEKQMGYLVKYDTLLDDDNLNEPLTETVDPSLVRPVPPRYLRRGNGEIAEEEVGGGGDFELDDVIDAYYREGWWIGVVKKVIVVGGIRKYIVLFENPLEEVEFERSQLRLHVDWIDRRWHVPPKKATREEEDGKSHQKRKRGRPPKLLAERSISFLEGGHEMTTDLDEQPQVPLSRLKRNSCCSSDHRVESPNQATVTSIGTTDYQQNWPFIKQSPIWATIASLELYQALPQKPHFSPLKKSKEVHREGLAIAHMVTFGNLVQKLSNFKLTDPIDMINNSLETLVDLETHGFDVAAIRGRLKVLLSLKSKMDQHEGQLKKIEEEIEKCNVEKSLEVEMNELEVKMQELQQKMVRMETIKNVKEDDIMRLQSNLHLISEQITAWELAFRNLAATPL